MLFSNSAPRLFENYAHKQPIPSIWPQNQKEKKTQTFIFFSSVFYVKWSSEFLIRRRLWQRYKSALHFCSIFPSFFWVILLIYLLYNWWLAFGFCLWMVLWSNCVIWFLKKIRIRMIIFGYRFCGEFCVFSSDFKHVHGIEWNKHFFFLEQNLLLFCMNLHLCTAFQSLLRRNIEIMWTSKSSQEEFTEHWNGYWEVK